MQGRIFRIIKMFFLTGLLALSACSNASQGDSSSSMGTPTFVGIISTPTLPQAIQASPALPTATRAAVAATQPVPPTQTQLAPPAGNPASIPTDSVTTFPDPANFAWAPVVSGLTKPLGMAALPDASGRMLVLEQPGTIRIVENGNLQPDPLLDIRDRVGSQGNEQGLLGIALHPNFAQNGFFYINYTDTNGNTVIARYQVTKEDPSHVNPNSEQVLLRVDQPFANHNGGSMVFGPDGYLYMGLGDGGSAGDPRGNGQSVNTLLGKLLRVDVNNGDPYAIPADNPFAKGNGKAEIWAFGLRNPWRFSFDRLNGDLYIADVGQESWEEIDYLPAGSPGGVNFGWNYREAMHEFRGTPPSNANLVDPVAEYGHDQGCSITGGFVYRGEALPEFRGIYLYSDYCSGKIWGLLKGADGSWQSKELFETGYNMTSFGEDRQGEIYIIDQGSGGIYRLQKK
jgi:glucose/arabinose dehydrogenase